MGLWLKSPPTFDATAFGTSDAIQVKSVESETDIKRCLTLRYHHFIATRTKTGEIVGTTRLVVQDVPLYQHDSVVGTPSRTLAAQRSWCRRIAESISTTAFTERLQHPYFSPLPILQSSDFRDKCGALLLNIASGCELSRVVVAPAYRGIGASRLLVRAAIAAAVDLGKSFVLLECVRSHAAMYAQYGFELIEGHHCRAQELDQVAVGMKLDLRAGPSNRAVSLAARDIETIKRAAIDSRQPSPSGFLCLCHVKDCWREGAYESRGTEVCPLRRVFQEADCHNQAAGN
jgi:predicted GNAT family N-acyltransferase